MTLDQIDDDVQTLAKDYETTNPVAAFRRAEELLLDVQDKLERTQRPRQQERLYLAAGQAGSLLSVAAFDLGVLGPATQFARTAAMYGQTIEHGPLQAYAHGVLAYLAYWDGRPTAAMRNIHIAKSFGGVGATGHMRLSAIEARAYAHLGRPRDAERAVQQALDPGPEVRDELHDDVGGEFAFGPARAAMSHATTYLVLKDSQRAEQSALHALQLLDEDPRRGPAGADAGNRRPRTGPPAARRTRRRRRSPGTGAGHPRGMAHHRPGRPGHPTARRTRPAPARTGARSTDAG